MDMEDSLETEKPSNLLESTELTIEESSKKEKSPSPSQSDSSDKISNIFTKDSESAFGEGVEDCLEECITKCLIENKNETDLSLKTNIAEGKEDQVDEQSSSVNLNLLNTQDISPRADEDIVTEDKEESKAYDFKQAEIKTEETKCEEKSKSIYDNESDSFKLRLSSTDKASSESLTKNNSDSLKIIDDENDRNIAQEDLEKIKQSHLERDSNNLSSENSDQSSNDASSMEINSNSNEVTIADEDQSSVKRAVESDQNSNQSVHFEESSSNEQISTDDKTLDEKQNNSEGIDTESKTGNEVTETYKLPPVESSLNAEDSRSSDQSKPESKNGERKRSSCRTSLRKEMSQIGHVARQIGAHEVIEYQWPPNSEHHYFLQEQISDYLEIVSFRRRYPELTRRNIEPNERNYLLDRGLVNETQSDLGLVPLRSEEVMELMERDFPEKCKEIAKVLRERERKKMIETVKTTYTTHKTIDKQKLEHLRKKAIKGASEFNSNLRRDRKDERRVYFDLQTMQVHFPQRKLKLKEPPYHNSYPAALIPGQYTDYCKKYNFSQLKCLPLNRAVRLPPTPPPEQETRFSENSSSSASEDESQSSDMSSEDESNNEPEEAVVKPPTTTPVQKPRMPVSGRARRKRRGAFLFSLPRKLPPKPVGRPPGSTRGRGRGRGRRGRPPLRNVGREIPPLKLNLSAISKTSLESFSAKEEDQNQTEAVCGICKGDQEKNKEGTSEDLVRCADCGRAGHPTCFDIVHMLTQIRKYEWQCMECKACVFCDSTRDEDKMIFCDQCDRGYHTFCLGLSSIPSGNWQCPKCTPRRRESDVSNDSETEILPSKRRRTTQRNNNGLKKEPLNEIDSN